METQNSTDQQTWIKFFRNALIPQQYAAVYANKFSENRIRFDMLGDLNRELLQEMGISALGDCLSILKHARIINAALEEANRKDEQHHQQLHDDSPQSRAVKKRYDLAKELITTYAVDDGGSTTKPTMMTIPESSLKSVNMNTHSLSADLQSRLNFGSGSNHSSQPVVKFNENSLASTKVVVSSTTIDNNEDDERELLRVDTSSRMTKLKRKLDDDDDHDNQTLEYSGAFKKRLSITIPTSTSTSPKPAPSLKSRLSLTSNPPSSSKPITLAKTIKASSQSSSNGTNKKPVTQASSKILHDSLYSSRVDEQVSVFDRIKTAPPPTTMTFKTHSPKKAQSVTRSLVGEANKATIMRSLGTSVVTKRVAVQTRPKAVSIQQHKPSLKDRLSFNR